METLLAGSANVAVGAGALRGLGGGTGNVAVGNAALPNLTAGDANIALGRNAGTDLVTGTDNIYLASAGEANESGTTRIGSSGVQTRTFISGIRLVTTGNVDAIPVLVDTRGQLGTINSSREVKQEIEDMGDRSRAIRQLRPVTFRYRQHAAAGLEARQYGLLAEEVAAVLPDLVVRGPDGRPETVLYHVLPTLLLNELRRQGEELDALRRELAAVRARLDSRPAPVPGVNPAD
jgi:hypothetical protein